jgi:hypothetical protein
MRRSLVATLGNAFRGETFSGREGNAGEVEQLPRAAPQAPLRLEPRETPLRDLHEQGDRSSSIRDLEALAGLDTAKDRAGVLTKLTDADSLHVRHCSTS